MVIVWAQKGTLKIEFQLIESKGKQEKWNVNDSGAMQRTNEQTAGRKVAYVIQDFYQYRGFNFIYNTLLYCVCVVLLIFAAFLFHFLFIWKAYLNKTCNLYCSLGVFFSSFFCHFAWFLEFLKRIHLLHATYQHIHTSQKETTRWDCICKFSCFRCIFRSRSSYFVQWFGFCIQVQSELCYAHTHTCGSSLY